MLEIVDRDHATAVDVHGLEDILEVSVNKVVVLLRGNVKLLAY